MGVFNTSLQSGGANSGALNTFLLFEEAICWGFNTSLKSGGANDGELNTHLKRGWVTNNARLNISLKVGEPIVEDLYPSLHCSRALMQIANRSEHLHGEA